MRRRAVSLLYLGWPPSRALEERLLEWTFPSLSTRAREEVWQFPGANPARSVSIEMPRGFRPARIRGGRRRLRASRVGGGAHKPRVSGRTNRAGWPHELYKRPPRYRHRRPRRGRRCAPEEEPRERPGAEKTRACLLHVRMRRASVTGIHIQGRCAQCQFESWLEK